MPPSFRRTAGRWALTRRGNGRRKATRARGRHGSARLKKPVEGPVRSGADCGDERDMTTSSATNTFLQRLIGAMALDVAIYEEVEADRGATTQAFAVVLLSSLAAGIGARGLGENSLPNIAFISIVSLLAWAAWALITFEIGARIMPEPQTEVDVGELLRTIGFASTPGLLRVIGIVPGVTVPVFAVTAIWMLVAMIVAVRQALDYRSTARAVAVCVIGWVLAIAMAVLLGVLFGPSVS